MEVVHRDAMPDRYRKTLSPLFYRVCRTRNEQTTVKEIIVRNGVLLQGPGQSYVDYFASTPMMRSPPLYEPSVASASFCISMK